MTTSQRIQKLSAARRNDDGIGCLPRPSAGAWAIIRMSPATDADVAKLADALDLGSIETCAEWA